jgi:hypothetical protein
MDENPYRPSDVPQDQPLRRSWAWTALGVIAALTFAWSAFAVAAISAMTISTTGTQRAFKLYSVLAILSLFGAIGSFAVSLRLRKVNRR